MCLFNDRVDELKLATDAIKSYAIGLKRIQCWCNV